jgi:hypothetical protein
VLLPPDERLPLEERVDEPDDLTELPEERVEEPDDRTELPEEFLLELDLLKLDVFLTLLYLELFGLVLLILVDRRVPDLLYDGRELFCCLV